MNYGRMKATADNLLYKMGMSVTLTRYESSGAWVKSYDPVEGRDMWTNSTTGEIVYTAPANNPVSYTGYGVRSNFLLNEIDGTLIKKGDIKLVLSTEFPEPQEGDKFTMDGATYNYVSHEIKSPAETAIVYMVQVRL